MLHPHTLQLVGTQVEGGRNILMGRTLPLHQDPGGVAILNTEEVRLCGLKGELEAVPEVEEGGWCEGTTVAQDIRLLTAMCYTSQGQLQTNQ